MRALVRLPLSVLVLVAGAALASCGDDDEEGPGATATPPVTASIEPSGSVEPSTSSPTPSPTEEPFSGGREPVVATPQPGFEAALLRDVRTGEHADFDRITFEFSGGIPGYAVRYVEPPIVYDPRGDEMEIDGSAFIVVRMERAAGYDPNTGVETYTGPLELPTGLPMLLEAERVGDFEAVLSWALGLSAESDFRVTTLEDPPRLVVDVGHQD
jgi:hypothetical protein